LKSTINSILEIHGKIAAISSTLEKILSDIPSEEDKYEFGVQLERRLEEFEEMIKELNYIKNNVLESMELLRKDPWNEMEERVEDANDSSK
jgi:uncharacterized membrane-anchored protein YjiN (DUF445 family)